MKNSSLGARPSRPAALTLSFHCALLLLSLCLCASASAQDTRYKLASASDVDGQAGNHDSSQAVISADGRFIAFVSTATNLVAVPTSGQNVFIRDLQNNTTKLVSINRTGTGEGNGKSSQPAISADGRYVAFISASTDLVANDTNVGGSDVFVRDMQAGTTALVSVDTGGDGTGSRCFELSMTPDGRYVAFSHAPPRTSFSDVFVRDLQAGTTTLVSVKLAGTGGTDSSSSGPVISANGRVVVFLSAATNLTSLPVTHTDVYARDLQAGTTTLVSVNSAGTGGGDMPSDSPCISADGRVVAFSSDAHNLPSPSPALGFWNIYVRDLASGVTTPINGPDTVKAEGFLQLAAPTISADGRYVAYAYEYWEPAARSIHGSVARFDRATGALSTLPDAEQCTQHLPNCSGDIYHLSLSADGRYVAFGERTFEANDQEAGYYGDFLALTETSITAQPVVNGTLDLAKNIVISSDGRAVAFPTHNALPQQGTGNAANIYRFTPGNPDPAGPNGLIQFSTPSLRAQEDRGSISIPVVRGSFGSSADTATVDFATADQTAQAGSDYVATSGTLTFGPGEDVKFINVPLINDAVYEGTETFVVNLSHPTGGYALGTVNPTSTVFLHDSIQPHVTVSDAEATEGSTVDFVVTLSVPAVQPIELNYGSGENTAKGPFSQQPDYIDVSGTLVFNPGESRAVIHVQTLPDLLSEPDETFYFDIYSQYPSDLVIEKREVVGVIHNSTTPVVQLAPPQTGFSASEADGRAVMNVSRVGGDPSLPVSVSYATSDGTASARSDYTAAFGTLHFAPGETAKTITVFITNDAFVEPDESFNITLSDMQGGVLGSPSTAAVTIRSDDAAPPSADNNPIDQAQFFVRQHYIDFLNREPDAAGLQFWTNEMTQCGTDAQCRDGKRINVSAAFFLSIEFQNTGYLVYRLHQAALGRGEALTLSTFLRDTQEIGQGVVVNQGNWQQQLEANKQSFVGEFVSRPEFVAAYPASLTPAQYVDTLNSNTLDPQNTSAGGALTTAERDALISDLAAGRKTRADVLRAVAENGEFQRRQFNKGFVYMQYIGYLRRNPDAAPDSDFSGYRFWWSKLNQFGGNYVNADMVKAFISSGEYRQRFGQ